MASFIEQARRQQIIAAAIWVLAHEGYASASLARIARQAGISKSVISYHFANKNEMFKAVFDHVVNAAGAYMTPFLKQAGDPAGQIAAYIRHHMAYMAEHRDELLAIGMIAMNHTDADFQATLARSTAEEREILTSLIEAGQAAGQLRAFDASILAAVIAKAIESALDEWAWRLQLDLTAYADELIALFERGMRKDEP